MRDARLPDHFAGVGVERLQAAVDHRHEHHALVDREAAIDHAAANLRAYLRLVDPRIPAPLLLPGARVHGNDDAPVGDGVDDAVGHERGCFLSAAARFQIERPGEPESRNVRRVDVFQRAEACFGLIEAVGEPVVAGLAGALQCGIVDACALRGHNGHQDDQPQRAQEAQCESLHARHKDLATTSYQDGCAYTDRPMSPGTRRELLCTPRAPRTIRPADQNG